MSTHNLVFTKDEAVIFSFALDKAQKLLVREIVSLERKVKIDQTERENMLKFNRSKLQELTVLNDRIQRAAKIRGW